MNEFEDYVRVTDPDGDDTDLMITHPWKRNRAYALATDVAEADLDSGELGDPTDWPRIYTVHMESGPVKVSVDMEYEPRFSTKILEGE